MSDVLGTAVLELSTDKAKLLSDLAAVKAELKGVADTAGAAGQAAASDWATMAQAITAVSRQLADQKAKTQELREHTSELGSTFRELKGTVGELAAAFGVAFSVGAAVEFIRSVAGEADALKNLSLQTQISIDDLQILGGATREFGVSTEELGRALFQLKQRIAGGDDSVATAYHLMGRSLEDIKHLDPVTLFIDTERGLGRLQGSLRDTAAADLFGARLGSSLLALSTGIDEAIDKSRGLTRASDEGVRAAAEYASAIDRATHSIHGWAMEIEGSVALGFNVLADATTNGATKWELFKAMFVDWTNSGLRVGASTTALATLLDHLNQRVEHGKDIVLQSNDAHTAAAGAMTAEAQAAKFMAALEADAAKALEPAQLTNLAHLKEIGALTAQNAAAIGVNAAQFDKYKAGLEAAKQATQDLAKAQAEADAIAMAVYEKRLRLLEATTAASLKAYSFEGQIANLNGLAAAEEATARAVYASLNSEKERAKVIEDWAVRHAAILAQEMALQVQHAGAVNAAVVAEVEAQAALNAAYGRDVSGQLMVSSAADTLRIALEALHLKKQEGISQYAQEQVLMDAYTKALYDEATAADAAHAAEAKKNEEIARVPELAAAAADSLNVMQGMLPTSASLDAAGIVGSTLSISGSLNAPPSTRGFGGGRASGGPVSAGMSYIINERGPEMFVPHTDGSIVPQGASGGDVHVHLTINGSVLSDELKIARSVQGAVETALRGAGVRIGGR